MAERPTLDEVVSIHAAGLTSDSEFRSLLSAATLDGGFPRRRWSLYWRTVIFVRQTRRRAATELRWLADLIDY